MKKVLSIVCAFALAVSMSACSGINSDYDVSEYIDKMLSDSYKDTDLLTGDDIGDSYNQTTAQNAAIRFLNYYQLNASESQQEKLTEVFKTAYANSRYTVNKQTVASHGYNVTVSFDIQTTFKSIKSDIQKRRNDAENMGISTMEGAEYIDNIIELCKNVVEAPTYKESGTITFDILVDNNQDLSINIKLFDKLDEEILPLT